MSLIAGTNNSIVGTSGGKLANNIIAGLGNTITTSNSIVTG